MVKVLKGSIVVDVRTPAEFSEGHFPGSLNIPLQDLPNRIGELDPQSKLLLCCASGMRSGVALNFLKNAGFANVENVGSWSVLQ